VEFYKPKGIASTSLFAAPQEPQPASVEPATWKLEIERAASEMLDAWRQAERYPAKYHPLSKIAIDKAKAFNAILASVNPTEPSGERSAAADGGDMTHQETAAAVDRPLTFGHERAIADLLTPAELTRVMLALKEQRGEWSAIEDRDVLLAGAKWYSQQLAKAVAPAVACNQVPRGNGYCDMCAAGHYERCRYVVPAH
jgi:hypothetical protein